MAKLANLKPRLGTLAPRVGYAPGDEKGRHRQRDETHPYRQWYKTARWQKLRWSILVRDLFTCQICKRVEAITSLLVADHKTPHRGDERLFWDEQNLQCLCKACHDSTKARMERRSLQE